MQNIFFASIEKTGLVTIIKSYFLFQLLHKYNVEFKSKLTHMYTFVLVQCSYLTVIKLVVVPSVL